MQSFDQQQLTSSEAPNNKKIIESNFVNPVTTSSQLSHNRLSAFAVIPLVIAVWFAIDGFLNVALGLDSRDYRMALAGALSLGLAAAGIVVAACLMAAPRTAAERARDDDAQMQALKEWRK